MKTYIGMLWVGLKYFFTKLVVRKTKKVENRCSRNIELPISVIEHSEMLYAYSYKI